MAMINSQVFMQSGRTMSRKGYLNLKLVSGISLKTGVSEATPTLLGKELNDMVKFCPWSACAIPAAFGHCKYSMWSERFRPNWFMPVHLGGYGVDPIYASSDMKITKGQRKIAASFVHDPKLSLFIKLGFTIKTFGLDEATSKFKMLPSSQAYVPNIFEDLDGSDKWLDRLAYITQAMRMGKAVDCKETVKVAKIIASHRLKPMSAQGLALWNDVKWIGTKVPICPPLNLLLLKE
jgi:hypothetical protein